MSYCPFCQPQEIILAENEFALAIADKHPLSQGHCPGSFRKQHISSIFDLPLEEYAGCFQLVRTVKKELDNRHSPAVSISPSTTDVWPDRPSSMPTFTSCRATRAIYLSQMVSSERRFRVLVGLKFDRAASALPNVSSQIYPKVDLRYPYRAQRSWK